MLSYVVSWIATAIASGALVISAMAYSVARWSRGKPVWKSIASPITKFPWDPGVRVFHLVQNVGSGVAYDVELTAVGSLSGFYSRNATSVANGQDVGFGFFVEGSGDSSIDLTSQSNSPRAPISHGRITADVIVSWIPFGMGGRRRRHRRIHVALPAS